jgi:hypothetical protein
MVEIAGEGTSFHKVRITKTRGKGAQNAGDPGQKLKSGQDGSGYDLSVIKTEEVTEFKYRPVAGALDRFFGRRLNFWGSENKRGSKLGYTGQHFLQSFQVDGFSHRAYISHWATYLGDTLVPSLVKSSSDLQVNVILGCGLLPGGMVGSIFAGGTDPNHLPQSRTQTSDHEDVIR